MLVYDPEAALERCFNNPQMVEEMIGHFYAEVDVLFPEMRSALEQGDLENLGHLGHRMKGTVVYLGAEPAVQAARLVERFCKSDDGTPAEAAEAVNVLERECLALKDALSNVETAQ